MHCGKIQTQQSWHRVKRWGKASLLGDQVSLWRVVPNSLGPTGSPPIIACNSTHTTSNPERQASASLLQPESPFFVVFSPLMFSLWISSFFFFSRQGLARHPSRSVILSSQRHSLFTTPMVIPSSVWLEELSPFPGLCPIWDEVEKDENGRLCSPKACPRLTTADRPGLNVKYSHCADSINILMGHNWKVHLYSCTWSNCPWPLLLNHQEILSALSGDKSMLHWPLWLFLNSPWS